jgi:SAM-dependent methyltransferase
MGLMAKATGTATKSATMRAQYGAWPYPQVPLLASLPSTHPFELHVDWLWDRAGSGQAPKQPRIWIAGCGTFQPYAFAVANPCAEIVATDLAEPSLRIAARRCRLHGQSRVQFAAADLDEPSSWPAGPFDLIECYGVLMNVADPAATLAALRARLSPGGVLRLMVYPHWSRARIRQLQRLAHLLGFHAGERHHPSAFRTFVRRLPAAHPLRWAFTSYADSRNDAGVVDAFLHAGDDGFSAFQLGDLLTSAGLQPEYWFHRPWAQPDRAAACLGLGDRSWSYVLDYLDLWQELRGNFVVCCRSATAPAPVVMPPRVHPSFTGDANGLRHRLRLLRLRWLGGSLPARTSDDAVRLPAAAARALGRGELPDAIDRTLLLGGEHHGCRLAAHQSMPGETAFRQRVATIRVGKLAPNPLYAHLFAAFERERWQPELGLPDVETQIGRWLPWADPLEARPIAFGLTPYGTWQRLRINILEHLGREDLTTAADWTAVRLREDASERSAVRALLDDATEVPRRSRCDGTLRELAILLRSHGQWFVNLA